MLLGHAERRKQIKLVRGWTGLDNCQKIPAQEEPRYKILQDNQATCTQKKKPAEQIQRKYIARPEERKRNDASKSKRKLAEYMIKPEYEQKSVVP